MRLAFAILIASAVLARPALADGFPIDFATPPADQSYNWSGYYAGVNAGWIGANSTITSASPGSNSITKPSDDSALYGFHAGVNNQTGHFVMGFDFSADHTDVRGEGTWSGSFFPTNQGADFNINWLGLGSIRVGYASGPWLLYGTGGIAIADVQSNYRCRPCAPARINYAPNANTQIGWNAGAGIEYMLRPNVSLGIEYLHVDLGEDFYADNDNSCGSCERNVDLSADVVRARISYLFGNREEPQPAPLK